MPLDIPLELWIAGSMALYMAWAIGANDVANAMGTSVGSGALTIRGAILVAALLEFSGAFLAGDQARLEAEWKAALLKNHQVSFDRLFCLNNMPISRFLEWLVEKGNLEAYMERLTNAFNPGAVGGLMCRNTLSISWDGRVFDCDFNQMLDMDIHLPNGDLGTIHEFDFARFQSRRVRTDRHCFGCTAGSGSSCGGATT